MAAVVIFFLGLAVGSFLNVLIHRLPRGEGFVSSCSRCVKCGRALVWADLIPVLSFTIFKRRCRYCRQTISWRYPVVESLTAFLFWSIFFLHQPAGIVYLSFIFWLAIISLLIVVVFIDLEHFLILDKILLALLSLTAIYQVVRAVYLKKEHFILNTSLDWQINLITALAAGGIFFLLFLATRGRGIGLGDVKLVFCLGFLLGLPALLPVIYLALVIGLVWGLIKLMFFGASLKSKLPFGSVLGISAIFFITFNKIIPADIWLYLFRLYL